MTRDLQSYAVSLTAIQPTHLRLLPPTHEDFTVYGTNDTVARARHWAYENSMMLVKGVTKCAHGLYAMYCPTTNCGEVGFDHTDIWIEKSEPYKPFILTHPYADEVPISILNYAVAHGLTVETHKMLDGWYSDHTLPIRLTVQTFTTLWPLAAQILLMLSAYPMDWEAIDKIYESKYDIVAHR